MTLLPRTLSLAIAISLSSGLATAQTSAEDEAAAEALFDEGRKLMQAGSYAEACPKFAESQRLDAGVGTLLYLGDCYERTGRLASAWATFRQAAAAARAAAQADREKLARDRAAELHSKLAKIVINVPKSSDAPGLEILRDETAIGRALWGTAVPVDAGSHTIVARAPGRAPWIQRVEVSDGGAPVTIEVPALSAAPAGVESAAEPGPPKAAAPVGDSPPPADSSSGQTQRILGYVAAGAGVVSLSAGVFFWQRGRSKHDEAVEHCDPTCDSTAQSLQEDATNATTLGNIGLIAGGALLATGVVLVLTAPSAKTEARIRLHPAAVHFEGTW